MNDVLIAPFTVEQVIALNAYQRARSMHPFTCVNRGPGHAPTNSEDDVLVATVRGWVCPFCDYTQDWAHHFMVEEPLKPLRVAGLMLIQCVECSHERGYHVDGAECDIASCNCDEFIWPSTGRGA